MLKSWKSIGNEVNLVFLPEREVLSFPASAQRLGHLFRYSGGVFNVRLLRAALLHASEIHVQLVETRRFRTVDWLIGARAREYFLLNKHVEKFRELRDCSLDWKRSPRDIWSSSGTFDSGRPSRWSVSRRGIIGNRSPHLHNSHSHVPRSWTSRWCLCGCWSRCWAGWAAVEAFGGRALSGRGVRIRIVSQSQEECLSKRLNRCLDK